MKLGCPTLFYSTTLPSFPVYCSPNTQRNTLKSNFPIYLYCDRSLTGTINNISTV
jgi:hypothetical protein